MVKITTVEQIIFAENNISTVEQKIFAENKILVLGLLLGSVDQQTHVQCVLLQNSARIKFFDFFLNSQNYRMSQIFLDILLNP